MEADRRRFEIRGTARGPALPVPASRQPFAIYQQRGGHHFWVRPGAKSKCRWFSVDQAVYQAEGLADLSAHRPAAAFLITGFRMRFPAADLEPA